MDLILENIYDMKYSELQKMAKRMGIKANMKIDKLQKAVKDYYLQQDDCSSGVTVDSSCTDKKTSLSADTMDAEVCETRATKKRVVRKARKRGGVKTSAKSAKGKHAVLSPEDDKRSSLKATSLSTNFGSRKTTPLSTNSASRKTTPLSANPGSRKTTPQTDGRMSQKVTPHSTIGRVQKTGDKAAVGKKTLLSQRSPHRKTPILQKRKRSSPEQESCLATPSNKRLRRSTFEKPGDMATTPIQSEMSMSSGIQHLIGVMKPDMNSAERKATLLRALDNKVQKAQQSGTSEHRDKTSGDKTSGHKTSSCIPRFVDFLNKQKPITPGNKDWTKIHQKEFEKFDSIDVYLKKKRQRTVSITTSVSKVNQVIEKSRQAVSNLKNHKTPNNENKPFIKPSSSTRRAYLFKSPSVSKPFQPTTFKTKHMNTNFGVDTQAHVTGHGPVKTATLQVDGARKMSARKSLGTMASGSAVKSTRVTPFKFSALNTTMADSKSAKKTFDLKASLARPMTWKPHSGKLKSTGDYVRAPCVKSPKVATRDDRRAAMASHRANKKLQTQMARRGVHV